MFFNNMVAVEIDHVVIQRLNKKLVSLERWTFRIGAVGQPGAEIGLPSQIDPFFDGRKKDDLWHKLYKK